MSSTITLTGRGGVVVVFAVTAFGAIVDPLLGIRSAQGLLFCLGCLAAAAATRKSDLLTVAVSPPATYFGITIIEATVRALATKSFLLSIMVGIATSLAENAPWLFLGTLLVLIITTPRGLPSNLRILRERIAADNPFHPGDDPVRWDEEPGQRPHPHGPADAERPPVQR